MNLSAKELIWASGLFEGEGCISATSQGTHRPRLSLAMKDEDSVRRFREAVGFGTIYYQHRPSDKARGWSPQWRWMCEKFEHVQAIVAMLWPGLGGRRRATWMRVLLQHQRLAGRTPAPTETPAEGREKE